MAGNLSGLYDQDTAPDAAEFSLLPVGDYSGDIVKAELKPTRAGHMIALDIKLDNERHVFDNLNIQCATSEKAEEIAKGAVKKIGMTNNKVITDTSDLELCRVRVRVGVQEARGEYQARNVVKYYMDLDSGPRPTASPRSAPPSPRPAPARNPAPVSTAPAGRRWGAGRTEAPATPAAPTDLDDEIPH